VRTAIFRIVQEALSNISKHARSHKVRVELTADDQNLCLRVQDWGRGFELAEPADELSHIGLVSMQERAAMMGGVCRIDSKLGEGTVVDVHIPLVALIERNEHVQS
jgi:signal transduction histidine kinase